MPLNAGTRVGPYEVVASLGAGGMGEVYRARDTRLQREVALKILPDVFAVDPERLGRFQREAQVLASLNHPNIATIHGLEEAEGVRALVLELVEGPTLAEVIAQSATESSRLSLTTAPNKSEARQAVAADFSQSPTITSPSATRMGVILGTAAYMSPEQARGKAVDKRVDIWAFGCVLYEMLTGLRAFAADSVTETIAQVIERPVDFSTLPAATPATIRRVLERCLRKDPRRRLHDIADATLDLEEGGVTDLGSGAPASPKVLMGRHVAAAVALTLGGIAAGVLGMQWVERLAPLPASARTTRYTVAVESGQRVSGPMAPSPDGTTLVFSAMTGASLLSGQLYQRTSNQLEATAIPGTEGGYFPFFSPDGESIGFTVGEAIRRVPVGGGQPATVVPGQVVGGGTWLADDTIVYAGADGALMQVPASGGSPQRLTMPGPDEGERHIYPAGLRGGNAVVFTVRSAHHRHPELAGGVEGAGAGELMHAGISHAPRNE